MINSEILNPGESIRPRITLEHAQKLAEKLYGFKCKSICELNGYDDKNFKITIETNVCTNRETEYVLKVLNSFDSKKVDFIKAQNELLLYLCNNNISCSQPIQTLKGVYYTLEELDSGKHIIRLMKFIPGLLLYKVPEVTPSLVTDIGMFVAKLDNVLEKFSHPAYANHKSVWMLESVPLLKKFLLAIEDHQRRDMLNNIIEEFENRVLAKAEELDKGIIHGDFNEQNILVERIGDQWKMKAILDFGDSQYSCYLFELAITMTYVMILSRDINVGAYVIKGYSQFRNIRDAELNLLKICIEARICQSLVMGAYSSKQDPGNTYILTNFKPGWELLLKLRSMKQEELLSIWRKLISPSQIL